MDRGAQRARVYGGRKESDRTERLTLEGIGKQRARTGMPGTLYKCYLIYSSQ